MSHPPLPAYDELTRPLPLWSAKGIYFALVRVLFGGVGRLSDGIRLGYACGFDSGVMLDYVYRNRPSGRGWLGRAIDRFYLDSPGWRGIRARGDLVKAALTQAIEAHRSAGRRPRILDVACGGGRYVLESLRDMAPDAADVVLRDYQEANVRAAQALAHSIGIPAQIERADAFSDADLARVKPRPNIVIVSGLHEIITDDAVVSRHYRQIHDLLEAPGTLLLTIQPWHPQLEFIARVLPSHTGKPWIMRLRAEATTRAWVEAAGFVNLRVTMEPQGIFGVLGADKT